MCPPSRETRPLELTDKAAPLLVSWQLGQLGSRAMIHVEPIDEHTFRVEVDERKKTVHTVTVDPGYHSRVTGGRISPKQLVEMSFEFLLEREPNTSILGQFELPVIERYFPEYVQDMQARIGD